MRREDVDAGVVEKRAELLAERIIQDRPVLTAELVLCRIGVVNIVRWIRESHVGELAAEHCLDVGQDRGVTAQHTMLTADPEVARAADRLGRRLWGFVEISRLVVGVGQEAINFSSVEAE